MSAEIYAVGAAFCFAASQVTTKRGLVDTSIMGGILISMASSWFVLVIGVILLDPPASINFTGVLLFGIGGLVAPGISRWASTVAIDRLGVSLSAPITQGTRPLIAIAGAVLLLGETLTTNRIIGSLAIVAGGWKLSTIKKEQTHSPGRRPVGWQIRPGLFLPVLAGVCFAASDVIVKMALGHMEEPMFGAMLGMSAALVAWVIPLMGLPQGRRLVDVGADAHWLVTSGLFQGLALLALFTALKQGDVSVVSPILASQPLAVFLLSGLLLRHLEGLNRSTLIAGCAIVAGTVVVSL